MTSGAGMGRTIKARAMRGYSVLELVILLAIVLVIGGIALERLLYHQEYSEKVAMELTALNVKSGLRLKVGELILARRFDEVPKLAGDNPVNWLGARPANYLGELFDPNLEDIPPGGWYYDRKRRELVYRPDMTRFLASAGADPRLRWQVTVLARPIQVEGEGEMEWATLRLVTPYKWF
jgi:general secretion pathway protein G